MLAHRPLFVVKGLTFVAVRCYNSHNAFIGVSYSFTKMLSPVVPKGTATVATPERSLFTSYGLMSLIQ